MLRRVRASRFSRELAAFIRDSAIPGRINLVAPDRSVFRFDLDALDRYAPRLNIIRISSSRQLPSIRLGEHHGLAQREVGASGATPMDPFRRSQPLLERALRKCVDEGLLQGFLTANVDYHQDEPLRRASTRLGVPFFVVLKETPLSQAHVELQTSLIGGRAVPDRGDHVFVGGPLGDLYVRLGSVAPDRLHVTGFPRFDRYRDVDRSVPLDHVVFFPPNRLHGHSPEIFDTILDAVLELQQRTSATLVLKCKDNRSAREVRAALEDRGRPNESAVVTAANPVEYLLRSALVIGSSTTALAEGLLTRARVMNLVSMSDLLGIPPRPDLGYFPYDSISSLLEALGSIERFAGPGLHADELRERRALVSAVLTLPEESMASVSIEREIVRRVTEERDQ